MLRHLSIFKFLSLISFQVWCLGNDSQTRYHINQTVDGNALTTLIKGLLPGVLYQVEVAAVTSAGVGAHSQPASVLISECSLKTALTIKLKELNCEMLVK